MKFIVEIPDERFSEEIKKEILSAGFQPHYIKNLENFTDLDLAKIFIGDPYGELKSIKKLGLKEFQELVSDYTKGIKEGQSNPVFKDLLINFDEELQKWVE